MVSGALEVRYLVCWLALSLVVFAAAGCERFPHDPGHTLDNVLERGTLRVGVENNSPWITGTSPGAPGGAEAELVSNFAAELGVTVKWHWASAEENFEALSRYDLDMVVGGVTKSNPWHEHVGFSLPYYASPIVVGRSVAGPALSQLDGQTVAIRSGSGLKHALQERGAKVVERAELRGGDTPVAAEAWEIRQLGFRSTGIRLEKHPRVMAVPRGENAMLMRLEKFLLRNTGNERIETLLIKASNNGNTL